jgi:hypothetical protein
MNPTIQEGTTRLIRSGVSRSWELRGFSVGEIQALCETRDGPLPETYLDFLRLLGRGAGGFLRGTKITFKSVDDLVALQGQCRKLVFQAGMVLPETVFFFGSHLDYQMSLFDTVPPLEDPKVDVLTIGDDGVEARSFSSFAKWFAGAVDDQIRLADYLRS